MSVGTCSEGNRIIMASVGSALEAREAVRQRMRARQVKWRAHIVGCTRCLQRAWEVRDARTLHLPRQPITDDAMTALCGVRCHDEANPGHLFCVDAQTVTCPECASAAGLTVYQLPDRP